MLYIASLEKATRATVSDSEIDAVYHRTRGARQESFDYHQKGRM